MHPFAYNKWFLPAGIGLTLLAVSVFAYTGMYLALSLPFAFLYVVLMMQNWKLAWLLMLFTVPASIQLGFFNGSLSTSLPDEPLMWMLLLLFAALFCSNPRLIPEWWWRDKLVLILILQYLWLIVAVIYSEQHLISLKFLLAKTWFLVSFFVFPVLVFQGKRDYKRAFFLVFIPLLATIIVIFYRHKQLGFNFRKIEKAINGLYYNHVDYSTLISMFFPLLLVAFPLTKGMKLWVRVLLVACIVFFIPAVYLTYARAAMLAVVFSIAVGVAMRMRLVNLVMPAFYALIILLVFFMVRNNRYIDYRPNYERTYMHGNFASHMAATLRGQDMSSMERLYRWIAAVRMSNERPWTGVGPNAFYYYYKPYAVTSFRTYVSRNPERSTTHNYFLYMLVEQGWPAMILYGILVIAFFAKAQKVYWRFKDRFYRNAVLGLAMMFAAGFINNFFSELLETHKVGALFYLSIALLVLLDRKSKEATDTGLPAI